MRTAFRTMLGLALLTGSLLAVATPAGAGGCNVGPPDADGRIREAGGGFVGQGVFNNSGVNQFVDLDLDPGESGSAVLRFRNLKSTTRGIGLLGERDADAGVKVRAFVGDVNITKALFKEDGLKLTGIAPGASTLSIRVNATVAADAESDAGFYFDVAGRYGQPGLCGDKVVGLSKKAF